MFPFRLRQVLFVLKVLSEPPGSKRKVVVKLKQIFKHDKGEIRNLQNQGDKVFLPTDIL